MSDSLFVSSAVDDRRVVFADSDGLSRSEHLNRCALQLDTFLLADHRSAGEDSDVFEHLFAAVAEARSLHSADLQLRTQTIDNQSGQRFAIYVLCDDQQRTSALYSRFENRQQLFEVRDLLIIDQDIRLVHLHLHRLGVGDEIRADISAVKLHTLYHIDRGVHTFCLADSDDAVFRNFTHRVSNQFADLRVVVGRNSSYLFDLVEVVTDYHSVLLDLLYDSSDSFVDTAFEVEWVSSCGNVLQTHANDSLCQNGCGGGTITCLIAGLGSYFLNELCTEVLCRINQIHCFSYRHTVFGDMRSSVFGINHYIAALRTQRHFDCVSQLVNATLQRLTRLRIIGNIFCHDF